MNTSSRLLLLLTLALPFAAAGEAEIPLWTGVAPGSEGKTAAEVNKDGNITQVHRPTITPFLPAKDKATGAAVLVIPGGGHRVLCTGHEGVNVATWLAEHGIAAFMLKYRLAREEGSTYTIEGHALPDTQRAMRLIRARATEWGVDPARLGAMGFSAGGELAYQACQKPWAGQADAADALDRLDARPSFQVLVYPGRSVDIAPTKDSPPAFLVASANDRQDIGEGLAEAYLRFKKAGASAELILYASGGHGFGVRAGNQGEIGGWTDRFTDWLDGRGLLKAKPRP
jgi:endo-1,4-beta-xylanase